MIEPFTTYFMLEASRFIFVKQGLHLSKMERSTLNRLSAKNRSVLIPVTFVLPWMHVRTQHLTFNVALAGSILSQPSTNQSLTTV